MSNKPASGRLQEQSIANKQIFSFNSPKKALKIRTSITEIHVGLYTASKLGDTSTNDNFASPGFVLLFSTERRPKVPISSHNKIVSKSIRLYLTFPTKLHG